MFSAISNEPSSQTSHQRAIWLSCDLYKEPGTEPWHQHRTQPNGAEEAEQPVDSMFNKRKGGTKATEGQNKSAAFSQTIFAQRENKLHVG